MILNFPLEKLIWGAWRSNWSHSSCSFLVFQRVPSPSKDPTAPKGASGGGREGMGGMSLVPAGIYSQSPHGKTGVGHLEIKREPLIPVFPEGPEPLWGSLWSQPSSIPSQYPIPLSHLISLIPLIPSQPIDPTDPTDPLIPLIPSQPIDPILLSHPLIPPY